MSRLTFASCLLAWAWAADASAAREALAREIERRVADGTRFADGLRTRALAAEPDRSRVRTERWTEIWPANGAAPVRRGDQPLVTNEVAGEVWSEAFAVTLRTKGTLRIPPRREPYYLDRPLVLASGQAVVATGAEIRMKPGSGACLLHNETVVGMTDQRSLKIPEVPYDRDILVEGGVWLGLRTARTALNGNGDGRCPRQKPVHGCHGAFVFNHVRGLVVRDVTVGLCQTHALQFSDVHDFLMRDVVLRPPTRDGVHFHGQCDWGVVSGVRGGCWDDFLALNAWDWAHTSPVVGPIHHLLAERLVADNGQENVRLLPGNRICRDGSGRTVACPVSDIVLRDLTGICNVKAYDQPNLERGRDNDRSRPIGTMSRIFLHDLKLDRPCSVEIDDHVDGFDISNVRYRYEPKPDERLVTVGPKSGKWGKVEIFSPDEDITVRGLSVSDVVVEPTGRTLSETDCIRFSHAGKGRVVLADEPIDCSAAWIGHPDQTAPVGANDVRFWRFRSDFEAKGPVTFDVSADERYVLLLDGRRIDRGPDRGTVDHWTYRTVTVDTGVGRHRLEAIVWQVGEQAPCAQLSYGIGGFVLKAHGEYDAALTTGKGDWKVGLLEGPRFLPTDRWGLCAFGGQFCDVGTGFVVSEPREWKTPSVVREAFPEARRGTGRRPAFWQLEPTRLPPQLDRTVPPGCCLAVTSAFGTNNLWTAADAADSRIAAVNAFWRDGKSLTVSPGEAFRALLDLGDYVCAYPELSVCGGAGAEVRLGWSEALRDEQGLKGDRGAFLGRGEDRYADRFCPQGGEALYTTPWWRCGRWCVLEVKAGGDPVELTSFRLAETRYPLKDESWFYCDDTSLAPVRQFCLRGLEMCAHETLMDCPYYEQQMYPGDTRVQLLAQATLRTDPRLARRAIELFDFSRLPDGTVRFNFPSRTRQVGSVYTLCYLLMYGDYVRWCRDDGWLRERIPGLRQTVAGLANREDADGLLKGLPGWAFTDWVPGWELGVAPDGNSAERPNAINNLLWILALRSAASAERVAGEATVADLYERKAARTAVSVRKLFYDADRGIFADDVAHTRWSEHAQCLAILADVVTGDAARQVFEKMQAAKDLSSCTVYFSHYLFETYFRFGRGDLFLKRLDLWRDYVRQGLKTPLESPDVRDEMGAVVSQSRSDCHAWGSHPLYFMMTGLAGITPVAPGFGKVRVAPSPGTLRSLGACCPHPKGAVSVNLRFDGDKVAGVVALPPETVGEFVWKGTVTPLASGENSIGNE